MKLVLFSISSLSKRGAGAAQRGGCVAEIGLPLPIIVNIILPDRQAGRREATRGGGLSAKTHPLKPKLFLIYMFRLFKTVTSSAPPHSPIATCLLYSASTHMCPLACDIDRIFSSCSNVRNNNSFSHYQGQNSKGRPWCLDKL